MVEVDVRVRPKAAPDLLARDHLAGPFEQEQEQVERLPRQLEPLSAPRENERFRGKLEVPEAQQPVRHVASADILPCHEAVARQV